MQDLIWRKKRKCGPAELAEAKLLTILVYFIFSSVITLAIESYTSSLTPDLYLTALLPYFICESTEASESSDCAHLLSELQQPQLFNLSRALTVISGFLPLILFLFTSDFKLYINFVKKVYQKLKCSRSTTVTTESNL